MIHSEALYQEDDLLMISALQHFLFCPRQCALIHIEQLWQENLFTAEGRIMHERVHEAGSESRKNIRVEYSLHIRSYRLGLTGMADVVEFHRDSNDKPWRPFPVEYKRGRPKKDPVDKVQLCAQALCLEEMLNTSVPEGALYYGKKHRRTPVVFDGKLRDLTAETAKAMHEMISSGVTPPPEYNRHKCDNCSLVQVCLPRAVQKKRRIQNYIARMIAT